MGQLWPTVNNDAQAPNDERQTLDEAERDQRVDVCGHRTDGGAQPPHLGREGKVHPCN